MTSVIEFCILCHQEGSVMWMSPWSAWFLRIPSHSQYCGGQRVQKACEALNHTYVLTRHKAGAYVSI